MAADAVGNTFTADLAAALGVDPLPGNLGRLDRAASTIERTVPRGGGAYRGVVGAVHSFGMVWDAYPE